MTTRAKRKLTDISFEHEGAHVALVSKQQGGGANNHNYSLILKSNKFSEATLQKMQQVKVTMELPDFLEKFFYLYGEDAEILASMMGYVEPAETQADESMEAQEKMQEWIKSKMTAFEIVQQAKDAVDLSDVLSALDEKQYMSLLKDQLLLEKAFKKIDKLNKLNIVSKAKESKPVVEATGADTSVASEVNGVSNPLVKTNKAAEANKELKMTVESTVVEQEVEVVAKSAFVELEKSLDAQKQELQKALESIAQFQEKEKQAIAKARKAEVLSAVKDAGKAEVLFKAVADASNEDFAAVVKALGDMQAQVEKSALFVEQGASVETEVQPEVSPLERMLKAKFAQSAK